MKHWRMILAAIGVVLLIVGAAWIRRAEFPHEYFVINTGDCHIPVTLTDPAPGVAPAGSVVLIHGLSANRKLMTYLGEDFAGHGFRSFAIDLPGHGDNSDPFTMSRAQFCATLAVDWLTREDKIDPEKTTIVGHSLGGAIAIRMADVEPVAATIAISPAPTGPQARIPANLLVFSASADLAPLKREAARLSEAAQGGRIAPDDFAQKRAFDLELLPHSTHTSLLTDRRVAHRSEQWMMQTVFPQIDPKTIALDLDLGTYESYGNGRRRLAGAILGQIGILLIFPLAVFIAGKLSGHALIEMPGTRPAPLLVIVEMIVCVLVAILILRFGVPLRFLHMYSADYLVSLLAIAGLVLLTLNPGFLMEYAWFKSEKLLAAALLAFATMLAMGAWMNWQLTDGLPIGARWLRFVGMLPFLYLYGLAEEVVLGPVKRGWPRVVRFILFGVLRLEVLLACVVGYYALGNGQILLVLLAVFFMVFSILQRLATDAVRWHTGSATAAALFGAILAAWFVATIFPLT